MTGTEYEKSIVALVCWQQMSHELYRGMAAYLNMLHNRAAAGWFEGSIYWNAVAVFTESDSKLYPEVRDPEFQRLLLGVDAMFAGRLSDKTDGALWCVAASAGVAIAGTVTAKIGQTLFFKNKEESNV